MLSDEEKKAIEEFKKLKDYKHTYYGYTWFKVEVCADDEMKQNIDIILNLIEKKSKEIEELKEDSCCMTNCVRRDKEKIFLEEKIKAKIEYYKKQIEELKNSQIFTRTEYEGAIKFGQSLLEKE